MFWDYRYLKRLDLRILSIILLLMGVSLVVISIIPYSGYPDGTEEAFLTPMVKSQMQWFCIGSVVYLFFAGFDYNKLREWAWILYILLIIALVGLFFTNPIQNVYRWYKLPFVNISIQPSELAKLVVVIALSWYLERMKTVSRSLKTAFGGMLITVIPFLLILKQPDLGTALVLCPITLVMFYFAGIHPTVIRILTIIGITSLVLVLMIFLGVISHENFRSVATSVIKDYQYERLNPNTHHQRAATSAIALGGLVGKGWRKGEFTGGGWLPASHTDSVFSNFGEHFGFLGLVFLMFLFYALIYLSFQVTVVAKDHFGRLLSAGIAVYLAMHILVNIGMMCGLLPITGVPLVLVTYGGSSIVATMAALGILQSIYSRRFMF